MTDEARRLKVVREDDVEAHSLDGWTLVQVISQQQPTIYATGRDTNACVVATETRFLMALSKDRAMADLAKRANEAEKARLEADCKATKAVADVIAADDRLERSHRELGGAFKDRDDAIARLRDVTRELESVKLQNDAVRRQVGEKAFRDLLSPREPEPPAGLGRKVQA